MLAGNVRDLVTGDKVRTFAPPVALLHTVVAVNHKTKLGPKLQLRLAEALCAMLVYWVRAQAGG